VGLALVLLASCSGGSSSSGSSTGAAKAAKHPPVVMLVFDEFSTTSLVDARGHVDAGRYPNFARLAHDSTWFPYATASVDRTGRAMRALLTGSNAGNSLDVFSALGRRYRMDVAEEVSSVCPRRLCPASRPATKQMVLHRLATGRAERFDRWLGTVAPRRAPTFYFKHTLLPHGPWRYLPSGRRYADTKTQKRLTWNDQHYNDWLVKLNYQRHLHNVGFTDRLLGKAIDRLKAQGLYDRALVVVTADNGEGFGRRGNGHEISRANAADIALTPLFVKLPYQRAGRTVSRHVRIVDVVPTIARVAHVPLHGRIEGRSLFGGPSRRIPRTTVMLQRAGTRVRLSEAELGRRAAAARTLKFRLFGGGLFAVGPHRELHGTPVERWPKLPAGGTRALLDSPSRFANVRPGSGVVPVKLMGRVTGHKRLDLAVAVNGTIVATAPTLSLHGAQLFSLLIPEESLQAGRNDVRLYAIERGSALRPL
jgi:hypothetical protein